MSFWQHFKPLIDCLRGGGGSRGGILLTDSVWQVIWYLTSSCFWLSLLFPSSVSLCLPVCLMNPLDWLVSVGALLLSPSVCSSFLVFNLSSAVLCLLSQYPNTYCGLTCPQLPEDFVFLWRKIAFPSKTMINDPPFLSRQSWWACPSLEEY